MPSLPSPVHTNGSVDTGHEINEYKKIIKLRNDIYAGNHPHFKPASQPGSVSRPTPQTANPPSGPSADKNRPVPPPLAPPGALRGQQNRPAHPPDSTPQMSESEINDILLAKSEVLVNAEIKLKRQRIEKELKRQATRVEEGDLGLEEIIEKAGLSAKIRLEEPVQEDTDMQTGEPAPRRQAVQEEERVPDTRLMEASRGKPPPTGPAAMSAPRDQEVPSRDTDLEMRTYNNARDTVVERVYSPPARPRYSATSQLRSPAAPQPVRPANMARVESQDPRIVEADEEVSYGRYPESAGRVPYRSRASPVPYIKPEPASPVYREPAPRVHTPERGGGGGGGRPPSRVNPYDSGGRARYDYPHAPPAGYYPPPALPPPVQTHRPYDPYAQRETDPYAYSHPPHPSHPPSHPPAPPPVDYTHRSYTPAYVPPVTSAYPPRPVYDDYDRRYPPPPPMPVRQPSRVGRRSASPPGPYRHARHSSRSVSPIERGRRASPRQPHTEYRPIQSRIHSPPHFDHFGRPMPPPPPPPAIAPRGNDVYPSEYSHSGHAFAPPPPPPPQRERSAYGDERAVYYPPQPLPRYDEPPPPRAESSIAAREADIRSYRDREYSYSASATRASLPPPPLPGSGYPPPLHSFNDYTRAPSRATSRVPMGPPPSEMVDYSRMNDRDYYDRHPPGRPDERDRERDYAGRASVRPEERGGYLPVRHASVRPDAARGYADREYQDGRRRDESRERYMEPPPPPPLMGGFGRDERSMQPPRLPTGYAGSEYGERYGGKY